MRGNTNFKGSDSSDPSVYFLFCGNVLGKLAIRDLNNWAIQELLLADLATTQYTRENEGPYSRINLD